MQVCLASKRSDVWYLDSGCSRHMTGNVSMFLQVRKYNGGYVTFGDNAKGKIVGVGKIGKSLSTSIDDVYLVDGLKHNLLSISQLCDKGYNVVFERSKCIIHEKNNNQILFTAQRCDNIYSVTLDDLNDQDVKCFTSFENEKWLWHRRLGHASMYQISKLIKKDLVRGIPKIKFDKDIVCDACQKGKQTRTSFKPKDAVSTTRPLELLHLDLFGPTKTQSLGGKRYGMVIVDDFSRYGWVLFLAHKDEAFNLFEKFCKKTQNEKGTTIVSIRSDHGKEFENQYFESFCDENGISHNFSCPRTPQQNGVVERRNRSLQEMARAMICENDLPKYFWAEAVNTACYVLNRTLIRKSLKKTPYELWNGIKPTLHYFHVFGCKCFILNTKDNLGKFDAKTHDGIFLGYSSTSKAYRVFNKITRIVEETIHVTFCETNGEQKIAVDDDADLQHKEKTAAELVSSNSEGNNESPAISPAAEGDFSLTEPEFSTEPDE